MGTEKLGNLMEQQKPHEKETTQEQLSHEELEKAIEERRTREHIEMVRNAINHIEFYNMTSRDFSNKDVYAVHSNLIKACANQILSHHGREFVFDEYNRDVIKFLMLYFNNSPLALNVFPKENYSLDKNIMLVGPAGTGKTLIMDVMKLYLECINSPLAYKTFSQTQMLNYFKQHNNIDFFTFNASDSKAFEGKPFHICINDIGLRTQKFFGNDMELIIEEFLYARYEIWEQQYKRTHITTNFDLQDFEDAFGDEHRRLADRFKMFNVVPLLGQSRR